VATGSMLSLSTKALVHFYSLKIRGVPEFRSGRNLHFSSGSGRNQRYLQEF